MIDSNAPAAAYDALLPGLTEASRAQRRWTPQDGPLPALYLSHGAPPLLDDAGVDERAVRVGAVPAQAAGRSSSSARTGSPRR